jgi:hypothetical protein
MALGLRLKPNPNARYQELFERARRARLPYDKELWLNAAFYLGEQYVEWADSSMSLRRIPRPAKLPNIPRPVSNKIMHFVNTEHAMALKTRPTVDVLPASEDPLDISNATVAKAYLSWLAEPQVADFDAELSDAVFWALAGNEGYLKWVWNGRLKRGDITSCSPLDVYPDPYPKKFKDCRYLFHSQFMDTSQVYDIYDVEVPPNDVEKADPNKVMLMREMGMAPVLNGAIVTEMWMKPNRKHPKGVFTVWTGHTQLVEPQPFPYDHGMLPITQIGSVRRPGCAHYTSAITFLRAPQMELNKFHQQLVQTREAFANPKWWLPSELELESDPDDSPNQILRGNSQAGALEPKLIQPSQMPPNDAGAWITKEMMDVVGVHEVSNAQVPGRVEAAQAIELLQESDSSRLAELTRTIKSSISVGYWQQLMLAKQYLSAEQIVQTYSREGLPEVRRFKSTDIKPGMRVKVTMDTGLARSRSARTDQLMLMWQNGIVQDRELMAEMLEMPISSFDPGNAFDIRLARNENFTMADGIPVKPNSWDNHDIHRRELNNYRKTQEYLELPTHIKTMFEFHAQMHDELEIQQLGKQLQIQQMAAEVANGTGFQMGAQAAQGQQAAPGPGGTPPKGGLSSPQQARGMAPAPQVAAAGAHPPSSPVAARNTPQGEVVYQNRFENDLNHPHV